MYLSPPDHSFNIFNLKRLILASTSTLHQQQYLEYLMPELEQHFKAAGRILFVPFARPGGISHDAYTDTVRDAFAKIGKTVNGLHEFDSGADAIAQAEAIFCGGGNTFVLVSELYKRGLLQPLSDALKSGTPYLGTSAGSNIAGLSMQTTNDMPIVYPPSFRTMGMVPFNLNAHYLDPVPGSTHMGETRETRIKEFHAYNTIPVLGLREGSWIEVLGDKVTLKGGLPARLFRHGKTAVELENGADLTDLR